MSYDKVSIKRWRKACHKEIDRLGTTGDHDAFRRKALVVLSVYAFGTDVGLLAELSGQTERFVRDVLKRLRSQRVLVGQVLRVNWTDKGFAGMVSLCCDLLVASGDVHRPVDPVRSAALKGKAGRKPGTSVARKARPAAVGVFTPLVKAVPNQLYQITEQGKRP